MIEDLNTIKIIKGLRKVSDNTNLGYAIRCYINKWDLEKLLRLIFCQACDNRKAVIKIVGEETLQLIEDYLRKKNNQP